MFRRPGETIRAERRSTTVVETEKPETGEGRAQREDSDCAENEFKSGQKGGSETNGEKEKERGFHHGVEEVDGRVSEVGGLSGER